MIVLGDTKTFENWKFLGNLEGDKFLLKTLTECCKTNNLHVVIGSDGFGIWCQGNIQHREDCHIAHGMFKMLHHQIKQRL